MTESAVRSGTGLALISAGTSRTRSRAEFVYDSLLESITDGRIPNGERLREEEIAAALGVSRTPVREALQRLHSRGILSFGSGRGLVIAELTQQQVGELYAMREILEGSAARFAAKHASPAEVDVLARLQRELAEERGSTAVLVKLNRRFHRAIYEAAHNQYLLKTLESLHDSFTLLQSTTFRAPNRRRESDEEHRQIVSAIKRRNADKAEKAARDHIRAAQRSRFATL
jgi:DNA-binding GntR family transcriptional regulator